MPRAAKNDMAQPALAAQTRTAVRTWVEGLVSAATKHWPEYLMEAACLGLFMISASSFDGSTVASGFGNPADAAERPFVHTIWCKLFGVNFATAPLTAGGAISAMNQ